MLRIISLSAALFSVILMAGCSGSGGAASDKVDNRWRASLGSTNPTYLEEQSDAILLNRYGFRYQRKVMTGEDIRIETEWKDLIPVAEEQAAGFSDAQARIIVTARPRNRASNTVSVRFLAETQGRKTGTLEWVPMPVVPERLDYFKEIADFLEKELRTGLR